MEYVMACYRTSDNKHSDRPASRMQDQGRDMTDFRPSCATNNEIIRVNKIQNNGEYRTFLINNADTLIRDNHDALCRKLGCECGAKEKQMGCVSDNPFYGTNANKPQRVAIPSGGTPPTGFRQISNF